MHFCNACTRDWTVPCSGGPCSAAASNPGGRWADLHVFRAVPAGTLHNAKAARRMARRAWRQQRLCIGCTNDCGQCCTSAFCQRPARPPTHVTSVNYLTALHLIAGSRLASRSCNGARSPHAAARSEHGASRSICLVLIKAASRLHPRRRMPQPPWLRCARGRTGPAPRQGGRARMHSMRQSSRA